MALSGQAIRRTTNAPIDVYRGTILLSLLLAINMTTYYVGSCEVWSAVAIVFAELAVVFVAIYFALGQWLTWCNIYQALMALFHVCYYLPAKIGLIDENSLIPISGAIADKTMLIYGTAILSFALGCTLTRREQPTTRRSEMICDAAMAKTALYLSFACFFVFMMQIGGPLAFLQFSYLDFFNVFAIGASENSRYVMSFLGYYPAGLLLVYFGLAVLKAPRRYFQMWAICTICAAIATLFVGPRGSTILLFVGWAYLRHHMVSRLDFKRIGLLAAGLTIIIPFVAQHRNQHSYNAASLSDVKFDVLAPLVEMGGSYRCLYAMVELRADGIQSLNGRSYIEAIKRVVPFSGSNDLDSFSRTTTWLNRLAWPLLIAQNGGMGSSGIGEPFVNFGYPGVAIFFVLIGWGFSAIEQSFLNKGNLMAGAMLTVMIVPMGFYVRDDISSALRACVWPWLLLFFVSKRKSLAAMFSHSTGRVIYDQQSSGKCGE
jgi:oligosaccharide repeat unit polymerase